MVCSEVLLRAAYRHVHPSTHSSDTQPRRLVLHQAKRIAAVSPAPARTCKQNVLIRIIQTV